MIAYSFTVIIGAFHVTSSQYRCVFFPKGLRSLLRFRKHSEEMAFTKNAGTREAQTLCISYVAYKWNATLIIWKHCSSNKLTITGKNDICHFLHIVNRKISKSINNDDALQR
jgi:hypothetical protein